MAEKTPPSKPSRANELAVALSRVSGEWTSWEPETLWPELKRAGWALTDALKSRIQALRTVLVSDSFKGDHLAFEKVVMALNGVVPLFDQYQHPSPAMIAHALCQMAELRHVDFSDDVLGYVAAVCAESGLIELPEELAEAQDYLDCLTASGVGGHLREEVRRKWGEIGPLLLHKDGEVDPTSFDETPVGIQLARMAAIRRYNQEAA